MISALCSYTAHLVIRQRHRSITFLAILQDGEKLDKDALMREALSGQMKERQDLEKKLGQQVWQPELVLFCVDV